MKERDFSRGSLGYHAWLNILYVSAILTEGNHPDTPHYGLSVCFGSSCSAHQILLESKAQTHFAKNLNHDLKYSGRDVLWWRLVCWKQSIHPNWTLWSEHIQWIDAFKLKTHNDSQLHIQYITFLFNLLLIGSHQVKSSKTRSAYVFYSWRLIEEDYLWWMMVFVVSLSPILSDILNGSAVCVYRMEDVVRAFKGNFLHKEGPLYKWAEFTGKVPYPRPGTVS